MHNLRPGITLVAIGVLIPLLLLPLATGYRTGKGFVSNVLAIGIPLGKSTESVSGGPSVGDVRPGNGGNDRKVKVRWGDLVPTALPYRFILALGVLLVFIGIVKIDGAVRGRRRQC